MKHIEKRNIQDTQKASDVTIEFEIKRIDDLLQYADNTGKLHKHNFYYILFLTSGSSNQIVDFKNEFVQEGSMLFMYPGQVHGFEYLDGCKGFTIYFTDHFIHNPSSSLYRIHQLLSTNAQIISLSKQARLEFDIRLNELYEEYTSSEVNKHELLRAYTEVILTKMLRTFNSSDQLTNFQDSFLQLIQLREQHYSKKVELKTISQSLGISQRKLNTLSEQYFGKSFLQVLTERQLLEVKRLLTTSELTIKEIAFECGFSDSAYLINTFKKKVGITPLDFRNKHA